MKWTRASFVLLTAAGILLLDIELATGIKCYVCSHCGRNKGEEEECKDKVIPLPGLGPPPGPPGNGSTVTVTPPSIKIEFNRCEKLEAKDGGQVQKGCSHKLQEDGSKKAGLKCDDFGSKALKACYCSTDLCNEASSIIGNFKPLVILSIIASVSTYSISNLFL